MSIQESRFRIQHGIVILRGHRFLASFYRALPFF
jgi:hypothetical protein